MNENELRHNETKWLVLHEIKVSLAVMLTSISPMSTTSRIISYQKLRTSRKVNITIQQKNNSIAL